ncbi:hypothetical protein LTS16_019842 [Friedmanniomyces endolithicus]|nr:hypothetical protein LTS16_019842 [Friedmanniomyces endolithicus]
MNHNAPHKGSAFEGYYSKFDLPSGAHLALIICQVPGAKSKPYMLSFTYVPDTKDATQVYQKEIWANELHMVTFSKDNAFGLEVPGIGYARWQANSTTEYSFEHADFTFHAKTTTRTPWSPDTETPEALLVHLPLPLHWHVQSLASSCTFDLRLPSYDLPAPDRSGTAIVHQEKNWAQSFPAAHMWLQARSGDRGFCCAGGQILGLEAFLLGYRSKDLNLDFRPPFATRVAGLSPFMSYTPKGSFFSLSSPFPDGHRENFLGQSFQASFEVKIFESGWLSPWKLVREDVFEGGSLEFGGGFYPPAGSKERFH